MRERPQIDQNVMKEKRMVFIEDRMRKMFEDTNFMREESREDNI